MSNLPQADGDPASDEDVWYRILTSHDYVKGGVIHFNALRGAIKAPKTARPWQAEISGRLLSMTGDIAADCQANLNQRIAGEVARHGKAFSKTGLAGVAAARVDAIRACATATVGVDVVYTPKPADQAHADLTICGNPVPEDMELFDLLQEQLRVVAPQDLKTS